MFKQSSESPPPLTFSAGDVTDYHAQDRKDFALDMFKSVQRRDPNTSQRFTRKVNQLMNNYKWPLPKKNPTIEEQILSPFAKEPQLLKTDMSLNTLVEASKQIKSAMKQTKVYSPSAKPITPFTVTTANLAHQQTFGSPRSSIRVSNLMSNGLSYPVAKKIFKKSPITAKSSPVACHHASLGPMGRHQTLHFSSIQNVDEEEGQDRRDSLRDSLNFRESIKTGTLTEAVQLPKIMEMPAMGIPQTSVSVSRKADEKETRANSMKYYTTYIRKVNEFHVNKFRQKKANYPPQPAEPTQWQKYKTYMNMFEEDDGTFPRVSELSLRFEADRIYEESKRMIQVSKDETAKARAQQLTQREKDQMQLLALDASPTRNPNIDMYYSVKEDPHVFEGIQHTDGQLGHGDVSTTKAARDLKYETFMDFKKQGTKRTLTLHPPRDVGPGKNNEKSSHYEPSDDFSPRDRAIKKPEQEDFDIIVNVKGVKHGHKTAAASHPQTQRKREEDTSRLNKKYQRIITKESETIKHLVSLISPKVQNFDRANREIEPYDDADEIRQVNIGQRLANLRAQIYKNKEVGKKKASPPPRRKAPPKIAPKRMMMTQDHFGNRQDSQASNYSKDLNTVITPKNAAETISDYPISEMQVAGKRTATRFGRDESMTGVNAWEH